MQGSVYSPHFHIPSLPPHLLPTALTKQGFHFMSINHDSPNCGQTNATILVFGFDRL